ncbi:MAG TPA: hypothetical protein ENN64_00515, partial [bacterium]|nr:hypothetical protein [bacterium]
MIFLDVETTEGIINNDTESIRAMEFSYIGVIDCAGNEIDIWNNKEDIDKLRELIFSGDIIVGYNLFSFDIQVIYGVLGEEVLNVPMLDIMIAVAHQIGYWTKLDYLAEANLGRKKSGHGLDAVRYFKNKEFDKLRDYCMKDVRLTKEIYDIGLERGVLKYFDRNGFTQEIPINWEDGYKNVKKREEEHL